MSSFEQVHPQRAADDPAAAFSAGIAIWRSFTHLPLALAAETLRFASRRLQAQAEHIAALERCGSMEDALNLQSKFLSRAATEYQAEATVLSRDVQEAVTKAAA